MSGVLQSVKHLPCMISFDSDHKRVREVLLTAFYRGISKKLRKFHWFSIGDRSVGCGPSSYAERPVEIEVRHTGPTPTDRFSHGESGLHYT